MAKQTPQIGNFDWTSLGTMSVELLHSIAREAQQSLRSANLLSKFGRDRAILKSQDKAHEDSMQYIQVFH